MAQPKGYDTVEELEAAETNGHVILLFSERPDTHVVVVGPFESKAAARKAQPRTRRRLSKEEHPFKVRSEIRHLWKG